MQNNYTLAKRRLELLPRCLTKAGNQELAAKNWGHELIYLKGLCPKTISWRSSYRDFIHLVPITSSSDQPHQTCEAIVFDAAAEFETTSLNKKFIQGPDVTNSMVGVLLRFLHGKVGLAADVEVMFHQVRVWKQDQDALRFLWVTYDYSQPWDILSRKCIYMLPPLLVSWTLSWEEPLLKMRKNSILMSQELLRRTFMPMMPFRLVLLMSECRSMDCCQWKQSTWKSITGNRETGQLSSTLRQETLVRRHKCGGSSQLLRGVERCKLLCSLPYSHYPPMFLVQHHLETFSTCISMKNERFRVVAQHSMWWSEGLK